MALVVRFNLVAVRKASIESKYPGGLPAFRREWNRRGNAYREDEHLAGFSFMGPYDGPLRDKLQSAGLQDKANGGPADFACGNQADGIEAGCDWLEQANWQGLPICWLRGTDAGEVIDFGG